MSQVCLPCHSPGTFSSLIHLAGPGKWRFQFSTWWTASHGCQWHCIGRVSTRKSTRCTFWEEVNTSKSGPWTQWVINSTVGHMSVNSISWQKTEKISQFQMMKISWLKPVNWNMRSKHSWSTMLIMLLLNRMRSFHSWKKELCINQKFSKWFSRATTLIHPTSLSILIIQSDALNQQTTTDGASGEK